MKYLFLLLPFACLGQSVSNDPLGFNDIAFSFDNDFRQQKNLWKTETKNDTLYLYIIEETQHDTFITCSVYGCAEDHSRVESSYRIPVYIENKKIVQGEKQYPKTRHKKVTKEVLETETYW